ncbi:MAG TPA: AAA family ATPase [Gemmatimonadaceae bacterium]
MSTTISVGVAVAPDNGATIEELFESADRALYEAKLEGRDIAVSAGQARAAGHDQPLTQERFVGRVAERRRLTQLLDESVHSGARLVAVVGEAGIGKSALVREMAAEVRMRAGSLVLGRCVDAEARAPLAPWTAVLQAIRVLRVVVDRPWRQLQRLLSDAGAAAPPSADGTRFALFEEVAEYLALAAAARPLVIVIDDMQWADETSWSLLEHVMTRVARDRILFCVTIREEDNGTASTDALARLSRDERFSLLRVARMSAAEQHDWLCQVLSSPADDALVKYLYRQSEGNPFFSVQMLRSLVDEHRLRWTGHRWEWTTPSEGMLPVAVSDLLTRRVSRLSPRARSILAAAATLGRAIDVEVVVRAGIGSEEEVLDAIDEGITRSVLDVSDVHGESHIAFAHALLVDIMRETINPERRKRLHQRVAEAMEELRPTHVVALAHHYDVAGVQEKAFAHAREAAERAASVYAHDEAIVQLIAAERHASSPALLAGARIRRAAITESAGRYPEAETIYGSVIIECGAFMSVAQRAEVRRGVTRLRSLQGEPVDVTRASCRQLLVEAEALGLDDERAALLMTLSQSHSRTGEADVAWSLARECLAITERRDDRWPQAEALLRLGSSILQERPAEAMLHFGRALELCEGLDHALGQIRCQINLGVGHTYLGALDEAESAYRNALARGRDVHTPDFAGLAALNLGALFMKRGRMADARAQLEEANELFETVGNEPHRVAALYNLAHLARQEGRRDDAMRLYSEVSALARAVGLHEVVAGASAGIGLMSLDAGDEETAAASWRSVLAVLGVLGHSWFQGRELVEALGVRMALRDGDGPRAQRYFESGVDLGSAHDAYGVAWLVATCAPLLADGSAPVFRSVIRDIATEYAGRAERMGAEPLSARFVELLKHGRLAVTPHDGVPTLLVG